RLHGPLLSRLLAGTPGLILPVEPAGAAHNWYNYTVRFDMAALGHTHDAPAFRTRLLKALQAEGAQATVWQRFILPALTVFQAKNGYGHGHPWSHPAARPVSYALDQYPVAQQHCDTHVGFTTPLRSPNGPEAVELVAAASRKVLSRLDEVADVA
ncbi:MAG TPA: hypothetical protein VFK80_05615, partial [Limnochordia bacterium]|nr:hypothetical protein [Limnochordia bacterium]